jgi:hypothetical protein
MATKQKTPERPLSTEELEERVYSIIQRASGLKGSEFKKELGASGKAYEEQALVIASALAKQGKAYRFSSKTTVRFFREEPFDALATAARSCLAEAPLTVTELKPRIEKMFRGFGDLVSEWLKGAVQRGELHEQAPKKGAKTKRYGLEPDLSLLFKKVDAELKKVLETPVGRTLHVERVLAHLGQLMGVKAVGVGPRERLLRELKRLAAEKPNEALLSIRELRARVDLDKKTFDEATLELSREGVLVLHHHDFPTSLSEAERAILVEDDHGTHYVGIALRRKP